MTTAADHLPISAPQPRVLLHGSIVANAERHYAVSLVPAENLPSSETTLLRFGLHYYARVLYELAQTSHSVRDLPAIIDRIASGTMGSRGDLFAVAGVHGRITVAIQQPIGNVTVVLRQVTMRDFEVNGTFGLSGRVLANSVVAVLDAVLPRLSADTVGVLLAGLANMNASYTLTHRYSDVKSCREVPAVAYLAAAFV